MEKINRFNLRVYGILVHHEKLLLLQEKYAGRSLLKFPGGGVEFGEGLQEALARECKEELNLQITQTEHFYTQDFFVPSLFNVQEQIQTVYYWIEVSQIEQLQKIDKGIQELRWIPLSEIHQQKMELPVDQVVMHLLSQLYGLK